LAPLSGESTSALFPIAKSDPARRESLAPPPSSARVKRVFCFLLPPFSTLLSVVRTRRDFLSLAGKSLGLAAVSSATLRSLLRNVEAATKTVAHLTPDEAATDEDYWAGIQKSFSVTRGIINLNNGGVSPSPRIVTEALVRYIWEQEDATAYTMWQILEPQCETIRTGLAEMFGCDREEIAITRNASESLETLLMGMDFKAGDEILTTTQDYPRMLTTL